MDSCRGRWLYTDQNHGCVYMQALKENPIKPSVIPHCVKDLGPPYRFLVTGSGGEYTDRMFSSKGRSREWSWYSSRRVGTKVR